MSKKRVDISVATHEDKRLAFEKMADEAGGFYGTTTAVTTAFLGGALYFCDKFLANGPKWSFVPLAIGAVLLTVALVILCLVRWNNVNSLQAYLESLKPDGDTAKARMLGLEQWNRCLTSIALVLLGVGLLSLVVFCLACTWTHLHGAAS